MKKFTVTLTKDERDELERIASKGKHKSQKVINALILCLNRRIDNIEDARREVQAWQEHRNNKNAKVNWQFTTEDARIKLYRLYPTLDS